MSLILDALKKADKDRQQEEGKRLPPINPIISDRKRSSKKTFLLIILLILSVGLFATLRYFKNPGSAAIPPPITQIQKPIQPQNPEGLKNEAIRLFQENKLEESLIFWERLTMLLPTEAEIYNNQGLVLKKMGRREEARQAYKKGLALKEDYPEALNNMGVLLLSEGNKEEAKQYFQKAIQLKQNYPDPYFNLALVFEQEGNFKTAVKTYNDFLSRSPKVGEDLRQKIQKKLIRLEQQ